LRDFRGDRIALFQAGQGQATVGGFASFITAMLMLLAPLKHLAQLNGPAQRGTAAAEEPVLQATTKHFTFWRTRNDAILDENRVTVRGTCLP